MRCIAVVLSLMLITAGCGPVYKTTTNYTKPTTSEGVACTFQCENTRLSCVQNEELKKQMCDTQERFDRLEYERCVDKKGKKKAEDECYRNWNFCSVDTEACTASYNHCYTSCGGQVDIQTRCVEDCEGAR